MPNNTISQVEVNGTTYDLLDMNTLSAVSAIERRVTALEDSVDGFKNKGLGQLQNTSIRNSAIPNRPFEWGRCFIINVASDADQYYLAWSGSVLYVGFRAPSSSTITWKQI